MGTPREEIDAMYARVPREKWWRKTPVVVYAEGGGFLGTCCGLCNWETSVVSSPEYAELLSERHLVEAHPD